MKIFTGICFIIILANTSLASKNPGNNASPVLDNRVFKETVKTPLTYRKGYELSYPVIELNSADTLEITFDELGDNFGSYYYTLIHCNSQWQESNLSPGDFMEGFFENYIQDYRVSFNTLCNYIHYRIDLPNENMRFKISGNYILLVYENGNRDEPVLMRRFFVTESKTEIQAQAKRATRIDWMKCCHEIDFTLKTAFRCMDPYNDIKVILSQNYRWDNAICGLKPLYIKDDELTYDYEDGNVFEGGNEFRWFDAKSIRYQSERVQGIQYEKPYYHFYLYPDDRKTFKIYFQWQDLDGKFLVKNSLGEDSQIEADYLYVHFSLPYDAPLVDGDLYVFGALSDWQCNLSNRMTYNYEKKTYELTLFVKQGFYDYQYAYLPKGEKVADVGYVEGNHYETEDNYLIFVYWHDITSRYDRLVGYKMINSMNRK